MENSIVKDFQNLRVLSSYDFYKMDKLVQDLTNALEDTGQQQKAAMSSSALPRKCCKKRRSRKYRTYSKPSGNISEASESSLDEQLKDYIETIVQHSDSDELHLLAAAQEMASAALPHTFPICPAESDSVNENISPVRPHRRRRRFKRMAVDLHADVQIGDCAKAGPAVTPPPTPDEVMDSDKVLSDVTPGKRKRALRDKSFDLETLPAPEQEASTSAPETLAIPASSAVSGSNSSSCVSSSESELSGLLTNDEGREGDDEQSDFYYEAGPTCGTPSIQSVLPWWDDEQLVQQQEQMEHEQQQQLQRGCTTTEPQFEAIVTGSCQYMSMLAKQSFKHRLKMLVKPDREIRAGKRRLKDRKPAYSLMRFLQDRQQWTDITDMGRCTGPRLSCSSTGSQAPQDHKRRRKTPPASPSQEGEYGVCDASPIPEDNTDNYVLQSSSCQPGTQVGQDCSEFVVSAQANKLNGQPLQDTASEYMPSS